MIVSLKTDARYRNSPVIETLVINSAMFFAIVSLKTYAALRIFVVRSQSDRVIENTIVNSHVVFELIPN
jgi:hypothetical protein